MQDQTRREFLKLTGAAGLGLLALPASVKAVTPATAPDNDTLILSDLMKRYDLEFVPFTGEIELGGQYAHGHSDPYNIHSDESRLAMMKQARQRALKMADHYFQQRLTAENRWEYQGFISIPEYEEVPGYSNRFKGAKVQRVLIRVGVHRQERMSMSKRAIKDMERRADREFILSLEHLINGPFS